MAAGDGAEEAEVDLHLQDLPDHQHREAASQIDPPFAADAGKPGSRQGGRIRRLGLSGQMFLAEHELHQSQRHHHAGQTEAVTPADFFADIGHDQRGQRGTDVDAHVKNGEARVAARIIVSIKPADDGGNIRFEKAHANRDQRQRGVHDLNGKGVLVGLTGNALRRRAGIGHAQLSEHEQHSAENHRFAHTEPAVGQGAAEQRQSIGQAGVGTQ